MSEKSFFIGWESDVPKDTRKGLRSRVGFMAVIATILSVGISFLQNNIGSEPHPIGDVQEYKGVLISDPLPMLVSSESVDEHRILLLVNPFKEGISSQGVEQFHLKQVKVVASIIHSDTGAMLEVVPDGITLESGIKVTQPHFTDRVPVVLRGEIVDSKCYLGMMNPGRFKPHRACAIQCVSGGIPPLLVVHSETEMFTQIVLVGPDGEAINDLVMDYIAEPVEVSGDLITIGDQKVMYVDTDSIKRL